MKIHEYQAKGILARHKVAVLPGYAASTVDEAVAGAQKLLPGIVVVKSQVHAGGRGKGRFKESATPEQIQMVLNGAAEVPGKGGIRICRSEDDVRAAAEAMLGHTLRTAG